MTRCEQCGAETFEPGDPYDGPGFPVLMGGTRHRSNCPTVPHLSPQAEAQLRSDLAEMDKVRRRGAHEARNLMIGGTR